MASHNTAVWAKLEDAFGVFCIKFSSLMTKKNIEWLWMTNIKISLISWNVADQLGPTCFTDYDCRPCDLGHDHQPWQGKVVTFLKVILFAEEISFWFFPRGRFSDCVSFELKILKEFSQKLQQRNQQWLSVLTCIFFRECWNSRRGCWERHSKVNSDFISQILLAGAAGWVVGWLGNHHRANCLSRWWSGAFCLQPSDFFCVDVPWHNPWKKPDLTYGLCLSLFLGKKCDSYQLSICWERKVE